MKKNIYIGIDPDNNKSGIAFYNTEIKELILLNLDFFELIQYLKNIYNKNVLIIIEKGELNKFMFTAQNKKKSVALKIATGVGKNFAITDLLIEFCKLNNFDYKIYVPKGKKFKSEFMQKNFGIKRSNQETRDAVRCILQYLPLKFY